MELNTWAERNISAGRWCDRKAFRASVRDLGGFREVVVAVGLALVVSGGNGCVDSECWVRSIERTHGG